VKRLILLAVAVLLSGSALLAIAILLVGRFGGTEGRILGTTALLAGFGLVALPAVVLLDKERARRLAQTAVALDAIAALLALVLLGAARAPTISAARWDPRQLPRWR
jgi:hypothetical protein